MQEAILVNHRIGAGLIAIISLHHLRPPDEELSLLPGRKDLPVLSVSSDAQSLSQLCQTFCTSSLSSSMSMSFSMFFTSPSPERVM